MTIRAVYHKGESYPDLEVEWLSEEFDLTGWDVTLRCFPWGKADIFTKTTGLTPATTVPQLTVEWDGTTDLDLLDDGTYVLFFRATKTGEQPSELFAEVVMRENAPNAGYCEISDLLLGDLRLDEALVNKYDYINSAADDINSRIGYIYKLPLVADVDYPSGIAEASMLVLKNINKKLASGRLIMAIAQGGEDDGLHAYGNSLVQEAYAELAMVLNGSLPLIGAQKLDGEAGSATPMTSNVDTVSAVDTFYGEFMGGTRLAWEPFPDRGIWRPNDADD